jgi:hypothetical protein
MSIALVLLIVTALLAACGGAATPDSSQVDLVLTEGVKTMVAAYFETQTAIAPPATVTPLPTLVASPAFTPLGFPTTITGPSATATYLFYTATFAAPWTSTVTGTPPTATVNSGSLAYGCNNLDFIAHVNYGTDPVEVLRPGENFTKTWKVANSGTCDWLYVYRLTFISGTDFDAPSVNLGRIVTVKDWAEVSLNLDAPRNGGTYSAYWRMSDGDGHLFGATLGVTIKVAEPTDTPEPPTPKPTKTLKPPIP